MKYSADVLWQRKPEEPFVDNRYSRKHSWIFDGGINLTASSSPSVVPVPLSDPNAVDPEEAFIASLSSCHMLFFLSFAARHKYIVEEYIDHAEGIVSKNEEGKMAVTQVTLNPRIRFSGTNIPSREQMDDLHHQSHVECYISNSVKTVIKINSV